MRPSTIGHPNPPTFITDRKTHSTLYPVEREVSCMDGNFWKGIDLAEHISE